jgi:hypothetical protein
MFTGYDRDRKVKTKGSERSALIWNTATTISITAERMTISAAKISVIPSPGLGLRVLCVPGRKKRRVEPDGLWHW